MRGESNAILWQRSIRSAFAATVSDSLIGEMRSRAAWQGAARANIAEGLVQLLRAPLNGAAPRQAGSRAAGRGASPNASGAHALAPGTHAAPARHARY
jgi:hypothetical protein